MPFIAPVVAAVAASAAAVSSFVAAAGIIGQMVIAGGLAIASSYLIKALSPKPAGAEVKGGVQLDHRYGMDQPRQVAIGQCAVAGHDILLYTFNPSNRDYHQVFVLSDYPTSGLLRVAIGGKWVSLSPAPDPGHGNWFAVETAPYNGFVWIKYYNGQQTAADPYLLSFSNPVGKWTADCIGKGMSYVAVYVSYQEDNVNQFLDFFFEFRGAPLYDPRKDTTVGGSGSHRYDDPDTHEYSQNPMVAAYHYRRGFYIDDDVFCGMDMDASDLPLAKWIPAMNVCDEETDTLPNRYRVSAILDAMATHGDNLKTLSLACAAMDVDDLDGSWPIVGTDQASVITFYDDDIISIADNYEFNAHISTSELVNTITGSYSEPEELYSPIGYKEQIASAALVLDRRTRDVTIDFPQVIYKDQCEQLASIFLAENRYETNATLTLRPRFQTLQIGDWVTWVSARYGWTKIFAVIGRGLLSLESDGPRNAVLSIQERDGGIYDGIEPIPYIPSTDNADPDYSSEVDSFAVLAIGVVGTTGQVGPGIRVSWATITDVTVVQVELIYYPTAQPTAVITKLIDRNTTVVVLTDVVGETEYTVKAKIITNPRRVTAYNAGATVTTIAAEINSTIPEEIRQRVVEIQDYLSAQLDEIDTRLSSYLANQDARNWLDKKKVRSQLYARSSAAFAAIEETQTVVADNYAAFAAYQLSVTAEFEDTNASVTVNATAIAGVSTDVDNLEAINAARYTVTLNVNGYVTGMSLINGGAGISSFTVVADKFQIQLPGYNSNAPLGVFTVGTIGGVPAIGISANVYLDGTLNARAIVAATITGTMIAATTISGSHIVANSLVSGNIQAGAINTAALAVNSVDINNLIAGAATKMYTQAYGASTANTLNAISLSGTIVTGTCLVILCDVSGAGAGGNWTTTLFVDGGSQGGRAQSSAQNGGFGNTLAWVVSGLSNASHTFTFSVGVGAGSFLSSSGVLIVIELRK